MVGTLEEELKVKAEIHNRRALQVVPLIMQQLIVGGERLRWSWCLPWFLTFEDLHRLATGLQLIPDELFDELLTPQDFLLIHHLARNLFHRLFLLQLLMVLLIHWFLCCQLFNQPIEVFLVHFGEVHNRLVSLQLLLHVLSLGVDTCNGLEWFERVLEM